MTKKTQRQPGPAVSTPLTIMPTTKPEPPIAAHTPSALLRSAPVNIVVIADSAAGATSAAPTPCATRAAISSAPDPVRPQASEPSVNSTMPASSTRRRPRVSASRPPSSMRPPNASTYAVTTQVSAVRPMDRSAPMRGSATFAAVASRMSMNSARQSRTSAVQRRGCATACARTWWCSDIGFPLRS